MFNHTKRFVAIAVAMLCPGLAALYGAVISRLALQSAAWPYVYVSLVTVLAGLAAYLTHITPVRNLEKPLLSMLTLLLTNRPWYLFGRKRIKVVWGLQMENVPDVRFSCRTHQGVVGEALRTRRPVLGDCEIPDKTKFQFSKKQLTQTGHVTAVWSWPI
jgi:hypothetical protein